MEQQEQSFQILPASTHTQLSHYHYSLSELYASYNKKKGNVDQSLLPKVQFPGGFTLAAIHTVGFDKYTRLHIQCYSTMCSHFCKHPLPCLSLSLFQKIFYLDSYNCSLYRLVFSLSKMSIRFYDVFSCLHRPVHFKC